VAVADTPLLPAIVPLPLALKLPSLPIAPVSCGRLDGEKPAPPHSGPYSYRREPPD